MANRIRNERLEIKLTKEEKALFEEKRKLAKCRNMSHFIRKCVLERVNQTGIIYKDDIGDMKKEIEHFSKELWQIHSLLLKRTSETEGE